MGSPKHGCLAAKTLTLMAWQDAGEGERDALACEYCDGIQLSTAIRYRGGWLTGGKGRALTTPRRQLLSGIAGQLGRPHGLVGRGVAIMLNQGNRWSVEAAVQLSGAAPGKVVADLGFGGGIGLSLLLDRVGNSGVVYGIDISRDMLNRARSRYAAEVGAGRLKLVEGSLTELPLGDGSLDVAITVNTLYFVPELGRACAELFRVLAAGRPARGRDRRPRHDGAVALQRVCHAALSR